MAREKTPEENAADNERKQLVEEKKNLKHQRINMLVKNCWVQI